MPKKYLLKKQIMKKILKRKSLEGGSFLLKDLPLLNDFAIHNKYFSNHIPRDYCSVSSTQ